MAKIGNIDLGAFPLLLAPMEDVSDPPFRYVCKQNGADMMYTEFISSEGLIRDARKSIKKLDIFDYERPIGIQFYGGNIDSMKQATEIIEASNPDLIDINYGCPVKGVACNGAGAGLLQDIPKMVRITEEVVKSTSLPVTVKTRLGWDDKTRNVVDVAERLQDIGIAAITIHGRTRKQMYKGPAEWDLIGAIKNNPRMKIPVFGNGDVNSPEFAIDMRNKHGVDGVMIGRAAIGYPWIFREIKHFMATGKHRDKPTVDERVLTARTHLEKSVAWKGERQGILEMRSHYANYFRGLPYFKEFRMKFVTSLDLQELFSLFDQVKVNYKNSSELLEVSA